MGLMDLVIACSMLDGRQLKLSKARLNFAAQLGFIIFQKASLLMVVAWVKTW